MFVCRLLPAMTLPVLLVLLLQWGGSSPALAQGSWLPSGKDLLGTFGSSPQAPAASLTNQEITSGLKDALRVGTERVVGQLGRLNGFNADPAIHIPLPDSLRQVKSALATIGMSSMLDDLELKLNRAAEEATPAAEKLFLQAISEMTLDDARKIYDGPKDAATRYFQDKMSGPLAEAMQPIVAKALDQVGAVQTYDAVMGQYSSLPFMPDVKANLDHYVVDRGMAGIFHYLAQEEAAIRENPAKRTTELLQKVFGTK